MCGVFKSYIDEVNPVSLREALITQLDLEPDVRGGGLLLPYDVSSFS